MLSISLVVAHPGMTLATGLRGRVGKIPPITNVLQLHPLEVEAGTCRLLAGVQVELPADVASGILQLALFLVFGCTGAGLGVVVAKAGRLGLRPSTNKGVPVTFHLPKVDEAGTVSPSATVLADHEVSKLTQSFCRVSIMA